MVGLKGRRYFRFAIKERVVKPRSPEGTLCCSFCHKSQDKVAKLISTPKRYPPAYICDECVAVCNSILDQDAGRSARADSSVKTKNWFHRVKSWWSYGIIEDIIFKPQ
jgi:ClpX C4-type zinc finger